MPGRVPEVGRRPARAINDERYVMADLWVCHLPFLRVRGFVNASTVTFFWGEA